MMLISDPCTIIMWKTRYLLFYAVGFALPYILIHLVNSQYATALANP